MRCCARATILVLYVSMDLRTLRFTKEQFHELVRTFVAGHHVRSRVFELDERSRDVLDELQVHLLTAAGHFDAEHLTERGPVGLAPAREVHERCHKELDAYDDDAFWDLLETRLGERDYIEHIEEGKGVPPPETVFEEKDKMFKKYSEEFRTNGIRRLRICDNELGVRS